MVNGTFNGQRHCRTGNTAMTQALKSFCLLLLFFPSSFTGCSETSTSPVQDGSPGLKDKYRDHFFVGSMIQESDITDAPKKAYGAVVDFQ